MGHTATILEHEELPQVTLAEGLLDIARHEKAVGVDSFVPCLAQTEMLSTAWLGARVAPA